jgi:ubiquinone/menaquinone biosynthesis C-methylase UbiE
MVRQADSNHQDAGDPVTLERIYPDAIPADDLAQKLSLELHLQRYRFASQHLVGTNCLDIACGCGYGSFLLAQSHPNMQVTGVDLDHETIGYARQRYQQPNLSFLQADVLEYRPGALYDNVVSLETIEHIPDTEQLLTRLRNGLAETGQLIASVPTTPTCDGNPHHCHDFSDSSFQQLLRRHGFVVEQGVLVQTQPWQIADTVRGSDNKGRLALQYALKSYCKRPQLLLERIAYLVRFGSCNRYHTRVFTPVKRVLHS